MRTRVFLVCLVISCLIACIAQRPIATYPSNQLLESIHPESIQARMTFLADDLLEGRATGTRGYLLAAKYIASEFAQMRLKPMGTDGTYFQAVAYRRLDVTPDQTTLTIKNGSGGTHRLALDKDYVSFGHPLNPDATVEAPAVFVGFGVTAPEFSYDDYAGVDVKGKIVIMLFGAPGRFPAAPRAHYSTRPVKEQTAAAHGAIGVIDIWAGAIEKETPFSEIVRFSHQLKMRWLDRNGTPNDTFPSLRVVATVLGGSAAALLFEGARRSFAQALETAAASTPQAFALPVTISLHVLTRYMETTSPNVAALLTGSDPTLKNEYVVFTAHADHEGIGDPVNGDSIYNGAVDNASGTSAMLEIARALSSMPTAPRRSILFLVVGGEEEGLLGSDYYARNPTVPLDSIVANLNMDGVSLFYDFRDIVPLGAEHSNIGKVVDEVARRMGLEVSPDPLPEQVFFVRGDQYSFVKQGVPAVAIGEGFKTVDPKLNGRKITLDWFSKYYHTPQDDMNQPNLNFDAAAKCTRVNLAVAYELAQRQERPTWNRGDFFERFAASRPK